MGYCALNLLKFLHEKSYQVYTYNPLLIKELTKALTLRMTKTDKKDDRLIALKLLTDSNRDLFKHNDKQEELKILLVISAHLSDVKPIGKSNTLNV